MNDLIDSLPSLKTGDSFILSCTLMDDLGTPLPLDGIVIKSQLQSLDGVYVYDLDVVIMDQSTDIGIFILSATSEATALWEPGTYLMDIEQRVGSEASSSATVMLAVISDITKDTR